MLQALSIKNYALIEELNVQFSNGFTTITGETGAGKSILLGGLALILGKRADLSSLRDKEKKCVIEAIFSIGNYNLESFFDKEDLDFESQTIIRREILPSGKSRAFVNDSPVKLSTLQDLSEYLIDIHSQNETRQLIDEAFQFQCIDALAGNAKYLENYAKGLKTYKKEQKQLTVFKAEQAEALKEFDYNNFLLTELIEANLDGDTLESLEAEQQLLSNVEILQEYSQESISMLDNEQVGLLSQLANLKGNLSRLSGLSEHYEPILQRVESTRIELQDVYVELEGLHENLEANPKQLDVINDKLAVLNNLMQKHSAADLNELITIREDLNQKVFDSSSIGEKIEKQEALILSIEEKLNDLSDKLTKKRETAIPKLQNQLQVLLSELGMPNANFNITLQQGEQFLYNGKAQLSFLFSANKGMDFNELKKAASGGELSRIMLAIKAILSEYVSLPTIMFDEIGTGVSGEIAHKMAIIMSKMSKNMQVFSITHLPQIAAKGETHFKVYKEDIKNVTQTHLVPLAYEDRITEVAKMIGGSEVSETALTHAKELLC